jgi:hypothetical protein
MAAPAGERKPQDNRKERRMAGLLNESQNNSQNRLEKLANLLQDTSAIENGIALPELPPRYVALEQSTFGETMWAYFGEHLTAIAQDLERSETSFVERIRVHDLDADLIYVPGWKIDGFHEVPS